MDLEGFQTSLLTWYRANKRDLPWRRSQDPWAVWVSEVMLQQTQVATVLPYYDRFMARFPTVESLANASDADVLEQWQGLGYYRRCRLLVEGSRFVAEHGFPNKASEWASVPGIGTYTAAAIASIAFNDAAAVVDGNVERVYSRLSADASTGPALKSAAQKWANTYLDTSHPGDWNQAVMELGATVCSKQKPKCKQCPIKVWCIANNTLRTDEFPAKRVRPKTIVLHHLCWIPYCNGKFGVRQITKGKWWKGMWEFPRAEVQHHSELESEELRKLMPSAWVEDLGMLQHHVTHHRIYLRGAVVRCEKPLKSLTWHTYKELQALPMPSPQRKLLQLAIPNVDI